MKLIAPFLALTGKYKEHHADYATGIFCYQVKCGERYHKHDNSYHKQITNSTLTQYNFDNVDTISFLPEKKNTGKVRIETGSGPGL